jgi:SAM-dependent MidA family methyltransferase
MDDNLRTIEIVVDRINSSPHGRITFAEYMESVLYHPQAGYYASNAERISESGDFLTAPHLAADFGEMLAIQLHQIWKILDRPSSFNIVEMGAGRLYYRRNCTSDDCYTTAKIANSTRALVSMG